MPELVAEEGTRVLRVGYALPARKIEAFMVPKFIDYAKQRGIHFIPIDVSVPLTDQGPFDCIIHKLYDHQWNLDLKQFAVNHPNATVIDPPSAIQRLHNRISMLQPVPLLTIAHLNIPNQILLQNDAVSKINKPTQLQNDTVSQLNELNQILVENDSVSQLKIGNQILVENDDVSQLKTILQNDTVSQLNIPNQILDGNVVVSELAVPNHQILVEENENDAVSLTATNGLSFPVIAKPLLANGGSKAHDMLLVFNKEGLLSKDFDLQPPLILQQFVNHGGIIFKVYVAGDYVECVKRSSLPDVSEETVEKMAAECGGVMKFSQISSSAGGGGGGGDEVKMPAAEFVTAVARGLRVALGLDLFNFDMIRDEKRDEYLVIDINYFPGYEKLPSYEIVMTEFFLSIKELQKQKRMAAMVDDESQVLK